MKPGVEARVAAARVLTRVLDRGGHSNVAVNEAREHLGPNDAAQVQRVVMAAIRNLTAIDEAMAEVTGRDPSKLDAEVRAVLRAGTAELLLDKGESHGVVDSAVEATRVLGKPKAAGLVNASLRRLARERPELSPRTMPAWITKRLEQQWGEAETAVAVAALDEAVGRGVRLRRPRPVDGITMVEGIPRAAYLAPGTQVPPGSVDFIDPASTAVAVATYAEPGMSVADIAAAPGGKTAALWDAMGGAGRLVATDAHQARLQRARKRLDRMGIAPHWVVADGRRPPFAPASFDRVLLDAPCTGIGTLRRRPEIRHRVAPSDPAKMGTLQRELLERSLDLVRPGGRLVYAVCTFFAEETIDVVAGMGAFAPAGLPGRSLGDGLLLAPHLTGTDGMFISIIER